MVKFKRKMSMGFTLIELLIVIAVIAVLVAILVPNFKSMRMEAKESKARGDLKNLQTAVILYVNKYNKFPSTDGDNAPELAALLLVPKEFRAINSIPNDPFLTPAGPYVMYSRANTADSLDPDATYVIFSIGRNESSEIADTEIDDDVLDITDPGKEVGDDIYVTNAKEE